MASGLPQQFGKYSLVERIAVGGMAEIWRAKTFGAAGFEKELVIKRILEKFGADEDFVRMFIDEARLVAKLQHANIVQIFDFDRVETPGGPSYYIAMELVDGRDLRQLLREGARQKVFPTYPAAVHVAIETLKALHYAHTRSDGGKPLDIVHRDVSPHNILVSYAGDVKLSDFGIAKAAARASATSNGMVKGKLAYMSPEQVTGQPLDRRTDVFSLGIVLYEMLTRTRLFAGESEVEVITRVRDGVVPPPRSRNPEIPIDLEQVLVKMLARDPAARYQSAAEAAKALSSSSVYAPAEAIGVGEFAAKVYPPGPAIQTVRPSPGAAKSASVTDPAQPAPQPKKTNIMANVPPKRPDQPAAAPDPHGPVLSGAATMMMEAPQLPKPADKPAAAPIVDQKTAILDTGSAEGQAMQAQIAAARQKVAGPAPVAAPAAAPIMDQKTAILDTGSAEGQALQAQIAAARNQGQAPKGSPPPAQAPIMDQKTAILDTGSAEGQALQAQIEAARNKAHGAPPPAQAPIMDQKTAILDTSSPEGLAMQAQVEAARQKAGGGGGSFGAPMADQKTAILDTSSPQGQAMAAQVAAARQGAGGAAAAGGGQKTMALDMGGVQGQQAHGQPARQQARPLAPLPSAKGPSTTIRWVLGPVIMLVTAGATYGTANVVFPPHKVKESGELPPPPPVKIGRIKLTTSPPGANVTLDGKPHNHFTPTTIEGPIGDSPVRVKVTLSGYKPFEQDVLFAPTDQPLNLVLEQEPPSGTPGRKKEVTPVAPSGHHEHHTSAAPVDKGGGMAMVGDKGTIGVFVKPFATVTVDGKPRGQTPIGALDLAPGRHTIELANDKLARREKIVVNIKSGENPEVRRDWSN